MAAASSSTALPTDEGKRQIPQPALTHNHLPPRDILGAWARDLSSVASAFAISGEVPHVVIDGFFDDAFARALADEFPEADAPLWHRYQNPLENKRACSDTARIPLGLREALFALCGPSLVESVRQITGLEPSDDLQADPYCHGGGLHSHWRGGRLDLHLDYSLHPLSGLERRFNLIVYLPRTPANAPWEARYGGALELRGADAADPTRPCGGEACAAILPLFNRAVLFSTTAPSFHGFPAPLTCPPEAERRSLALYYLTPPRVGAPRRSKALYVATPGEPDSEELDRLRALRAQRRLTNADLAVGAAS